MKFTLSSRFQFDAAHSLDRSESSRRVHGHTYFAEVSVSGEPARNGMVMDLGHLETVLQAIRGRLDHRMLNEEVPGLGLPTLENLARFIFESAADHAPVRSVLVWRVDGGSCRVEAT